MTTEQAEEKLRILVNSNANMSRGKYAAAAVHAALTAAGVHPGLPVIVLGGQRDDVVRCTTIIRDAGKTEDEPGTPTAGTDWMPTPPADDVREALRSDVADETREGWQMEGASTQRRWHYIVGSTSLCGRFGFYFGEIGPPLQPGNPGRDCAACVSRAACRIEKARQSVQEHDHTNRSEGTES